MTGCSAPVTMNSASRAGDDMSGAKPPAGAESGADPSMEDILASIRRILNEDEAPPAGPDPAPEEPQAPAPAPTPPQATPVVEDDGVLVLDEAMLVSSPVEEPPPAPPPEPSPIPVETAPAPPPLPDMIPLSAGDHLSGLMAPESTAAAAASVGSLLRTLSQERTTQVHRGGPTIEDLVREEVRPLLKEWLDLHLPPLVERLVRQEIERVAGRAAP